jgi:Cu/Ag efflux pump CusA
MIHRIVQAALRQRFLVLMFTVFLAVSSALFCSTCRSGP